MKIPIFLMIGNKKVSTSSEKVYSILFKNLIPGIG